MIVGDCEDAAEVAIFENMVVHPLDYVVVERVMLVNVHCRYACVGVSVDQVPDGSEPCRQTGECDTDVNYKKGI